MPAEQDPGSALAELAQDRTRGAAEIARQARRQLARLPETGAGSSQIEEEAREATLALLQAHPSMAPLVHLADETLQGLEEQGPQALAGLPREPPVEQQVARQAGPELRRADTVVTYSRSGTVLAVLEQALAETELRVILSEARPGGEGIDVASRLAEAGARVELTYDAALPARVGEADLVLVGADAITAESFVNKTGTRPLLAQARRTGTPTRVLASSDKLWPASLPDPAREAEAHWRPDVPDGVAVEAPLFERVPLELADAVVTENGSQEPSQLAARIDTIDVHPAVRDAL